MPFYTLFETTIGWCGIVWSVKGVSGIQLPEPNQRETRARVLKRFPKANESSPPANVQRVIDAIGALLRGENIDFAFVELDWDRTPEFSRRVYEIARGIGHGTTMTYGEVADHLGNRELARDVGKALGQNPFPIVIPCHRVLAAGGKVGGFSAAGGADTKLRLLAIEGAEIGGQLALF